MFVIEYKSVALIYGSSHLKYQYISKLIIININNKITFVHIKTTFSMYKAFM